MSISWRTLALVVAAIAILFGVEGCASLRGGDRAELVRAGLSQVGRPYRYGGEAPRTGFDCSGLTHYAHQQVGIAIPRTAAAQQRAARAVRKRALRPGDLVFFETSPGVHHVGLMIDAERFVHAATSRRQVRVDRLAQPYWQARYLGAGTFLKN